MTYVPKVYDYGDEETNFNLKREVNTMQSAVHEMSAGRSQTMPKSKITLHQMITAGMERKGVSVRDLAVEISQSYEYTRMIVRGQRLPALGTLTHICKVLDIDPEEARRVRKLEELALDTGDVYSVLPSGLREIAESWDGLTSAQKDFLTNAAREWLSQKKH